MPTIDNAVTIGMHNLVPSALVFGHDLTGGPVWKRGENRNFMATPGHFFRDIVSDARRGNRLGREDAGDNKDAHFRAALVYVVDLSHPGHITSYSFVEIDFWVVF